METETGKTQDVFVEMSPKQILDKSGLEMLIYCIYIYAVVEAREQLRIGW